MNNLFNTYQILGCISIIVFGAVALLGALGWWACESKLIKAIDEKQKISSECSEQAAALEKLYSKYSFVHNELTKVSADCKNATERAKELELELNLCSVDRDNYRTRLEACLKATREAVDTNG